jgi:hypothetical protein
MGDLNPFVEPAALPIEPDLPALILQELPGIALLLFHPSTP